MSCRHGSSAAHSDILLCAALAVCPSRLQPLCLLNTSPAAMPLHSLGMPQVDCRLQLESMIMVLLIHRPV